MSDVTKPTLTYFALGGKAEGIRLALEVAGVDYVYHPISFRGSAGDDWNDYKAKHEKELTFGQVPRYQEPGGVNLVQSSSITRYIAKKYGLNGANDNEAIAIDVLYEGTQDLLTAVGKAAWADESSKAAEVSKLLTESAPKLFAHFQRALEANHGGSGVLVGDKVSYADVYLYLALKRIADFPGGKEAIEKFGPLAAYFDRLHNHAAIKKFYDSDPYKF